MSYDKGAATNTFGSTAVKELTRGFMEYIAWLQNNTSKRHFDLGSVADALLVQNNPMANIYIIPQKDEDGKEFSRSKKGKEILKKYNINI